MDNKFRFTWNVVDKYGVQFIRLKDRTTGLSWMIDNSDGLALELVRFIVYGKTLSIERYKTNDA
jgi:hypothetical protein